MKTLVILHYFVLDDQGEYKTDGIFSLPKFTSDNIDYEMK